MAVGAGGGNGGPDSPPEGGWVGLPGASPCSGTPWLFPSLCISLQPPMGCVTRRKSCPSLGLSLFLWGMRAFSPRALRRAVRGIQGQREVAPSSVQGEGFWATSLRGRDPLNQLDLGAPHTCPCSSSEPVGRWGAAGWAAHSPGSRSSRKGIRENCKTNHRAQHVGPGGPGQPWAPWASDAREDQTWDPGALGAFWVGRGLLADAPLPPSRDSHTCGPTGPSPGALASCSDYCSSAWLPLHDPTGGL